MRVPKFVEKLLASLFLLHYTSAPLSLLISGGANEGDGTSLDIASGGDSPIIWFVFLLSYGMSFFLLALRRKKTFYVLSKSKLIWGLLIFVSASVLWSVAPDITIRRVIALMGTTFFGYYLAVSYSLKQFLQLLVLTFTISIVLSFIFIVALPKYGIMGATHAGAWRGIYPHKNILGKLMVISAVTFLLTALDDKRNSFILWLGFFLSIVLLTFAKSTTSLLTLIAMIVLIPVCFNLRMHYKIMVISLIFTTTIGSILSVIFISNADFFLLSLGKDPTLTGRTALWETIFDKILQHPILGYGYGAFWRGWDSDAGDVWRLANWTAPNAHNGWIDLCLDLGFFGASMFVFVFCITLVNALTRVRQERNFTSLFPLLMIVYLVISNFGESKLLRQHEISWVLYVALSLLVSVPNKIFLKAGQTKVN